MNDFKVPLLSYLSCWFMIVWWSSQIDGRVRTLEAESLNIARENRRYIEQVIQPSYGISSSWKKINTTMSGF